MDLGELVGMTPEIIQKVLYALAWWESCWTSLCLESNMSKNRIHLEMECSRTEHTLNRAAWLL